MSLCLFLLRFICYFYLWDRGSSVYVRMWCHFIMRESLSVENNNNDLLWSHSLRCSKQHLKMPLFLAVFFLQLESTTIKFCLVMNDWCLMFCVTTAAQFPRYLKYQIAELARQHLFTPLLNIHENDTGFTIFSALLACLDHVWLMDCVWYSTWL